MDPARPGALENRDRIAYLRRLALPDTVDTTGETPETPPPAPAKPIEPDPPAPLFDFEHGSDKQNISLARYAVKHGLIRVGVMPEAITEMADKALRIADDAMEAGRPGTAIQAMKLANELHQANIRTVEMLDKANRLDEGKPTAIVGKAPEEIERIKRIVSRSKGTVPPEILAREAQPETPVD